MLLKRSQPNLLEGPIFGKIMRFAIPLMLTNLLQRLYNSADMIIVGMSGVPGAIGAIGTTSAMINLLINLISGFAVGANVLVSRTIGAGERGQTQRAVHTGLCASVLFGMVCFFVGMLACKPLLILMGNEGSVLELATLYSRWYFAGVPFLAITNVCSAIFRAKGDTDTPLVVLGISGALNVLMNLFFVLVCGMSVEGVAIATSLSQVFSAAVLVYKLCHDSGWCRVQLRKLRIYLSEFKEILAVGIPSSVQTSLFSISNMLIQSSVVQINNTMYPGGSAVLDGHAAAANIEHLVHAVQISVYEAAITFISQHRGAGLYKRMGKVRWNCYLATFLATSLASGLVLIFSDFLIGLYVHEPAAIEVSHIYFRYLVVPYFTLGLMNIGSGFLRGMGKSTLSTIISFSGACVFRVIWILVVFRAYPSLECIYISYPISWVLTLMVHVLVGNRVYKKAMQQQALSA